MKKISIVILLIIGASVFCCNLFTSCKRSTEDFKEQLKVYLEKDLPVVNIASDKYAAYFDFTGAMTACLDSSIDSTFNGLCQKITSNASQFDIYKLGNDTITMLSGDVRPAAIFEQLRSASDKIEFYAPIEKTLKKITEEGRSTFLITDFEEYTTDGQIYRQAYATPYFKKWLSAGGDITFFVTDYKEGNLDKHLYYIVFDYNEHKLLELVRNGLSGMPKNYNEFTLSTNAYPIATNYPSAAQGGTYHDETGEDIVSCSVEDGSSDGFFKLEHLRAESYCFECNWEDIVQNASQQTKANGASVPFTHLFRNLFVDFSKNNSYKVKSLKVKVTDIQDDFDKYWGYHVAINNKPKIEKEAGETYLDFEGVEDGEQYYDQNGRILSKWDYSEKPGNISEIQDLLVFDDELFNNSFSKNPSQVELGIYFKKGATGQILQQNDEDPIYRIDIVIADAEICDLNMIDQLFYWPGNDCLSASIKSTLQDMIPLGKPIYSYFVRIL